MGGRLAMNYALDQAEQVSKLIVADMSLREGRIREEHRAILDAIRLIDLSNMKSLNEIEASLTDYIFNKRRVQFVLKNIKRGSQGYHWKLNPIALMDNISKIMPELFSSSSYDGVSLFIRGGASDYILKEDEPAIFKHFPKTRIETIEGASHWLHADKPQEFIKIVEDFI